MRFGLGRGNREFDRAGTPCNLVKPGLYRLCILTRRRGDAESENKGESTPENAEEAEEEEEEERLSHLGIGGTPRRAVLRPTWCSRDCTGFVF
jgi:hypothetical protein